MTVASGASLHAKTRPHRDVSAFGRVRLDREMWCSPRREPEDAKVKTLSLTGDQCRERDKC